MRTKAYYVWWGHGLTHVNPHGGTTPIRSRLALILWTVDAYHQSGRVAIDFWREMLLLLISSQC